MLAAAGCKPEAHLEINLSKSPLQFNVVPDGAACVDSLSVLGAHGSVLWRIYSRSSCGYHFEYCKLPKSFVQEGACTPLRHGEGYSVITVGDGIRPGTAFVY